ncbi:MAG TPA: SDR family NAD(P)-dependent oxidoreductase [Kiloniellales bacterium]|jgi:NAD(P)-dependent dehydrogenase (short-subunit alcohol dehydrogenase family)
MSQPVAVIVGAGPGLGAALARRFAKAGMTVAVARRNASKLGKLGKLATEIGGKAYACDATDAAAVENLFAAVTRDLGTPVLAVFNAGAYRPGGILDIDPGDFEECWRIGCLGGLNVGQAALRRMVPAGAGTILYTGATASLRGSAGFANLAVPKFGLRALAQSMAREFGPKGIHVAHVLIDGQIGRDGGGVNKLGPSAIAEAYLHLYEQHPSAWAQEMDLRPNVEKF